MKFTTKVTGVEFEEDEIKKLKDAYYTLDKMYYEFDSSYSNPNDIVDESVIDLFNQIEDVKKNILYLLITMGEDNDLE